MKPSSYPSSKIGGKLGITTLTRYLNRRYAVTTVGFSSDPMDQPPSKLTHKPGPIVRERHSIIFRFDCSFIYIHTYGTIFLFTFAVLFSWNILLSEDTNPYCISKSYFQSDNTVLLSKKSAVSGYTLRRTELVQPICGVNI